jgi:hexokinase
MSLLAEAKRVAAEFEFTDDDVRAIGDEFVAEMSACKPSNTYGQSELTMAQMRAWQRMPRP